MCGHGRGDRGGFPGGDRAADVEADGGKARNGSIHSADDHGRRFGGRCVCHRVVFQLSDFGAGGKDDGCLAASVPVSIITGVLTGALIGLALCWFFRSVHLRDSIKVLILMSAAFLLLEAETQLKAILPFSGLLAVMAMGIAIYSRYLVLAQRLSQKFSRLWVGAEMMLFVLVGAVVNPAYLFKAGGPLMLLILMALFCRMAAVAVCLIKTPPNPEGTAFLYDRLLSESDRPGCNRRGSAESGLGLRRACLKRGGDGDSDHSAVGGAGDRSDLPAMAEKAEPLPAEAES